MERIGNRDGISFNEYREIVLGYNKMNKNPTLTQELLEKCKKKMRERQSGISENELIIRKKEKLNIYKFKNRSIRVFRMLGIYGFRIQ